MSEEKKKKGKREPRNKARDVLTDYYRTNREYARENNERIEAENRESGEAPGKWKPAEAAMLIVIILGAAGIVIKYFIL
jgi:hypothetical protein